MAKEQSFDWARDGSDGTCRAVSFFQALDRAKVQFLTFRGFPPKSPRFGINKADLKERFFKITLNPLTFQRYKELYMGFKEDQLTTVDKQELAQFQSFYKARDDYERPYKR